VDAQFSNPRVLAEGFWFPVGRSNFFDAEQDAALIAAYNAYDEARNGPLQGYKAAEIRIEHPKLQVSVYQRLITVLPSRCRPIQDDMRPPESMRYSRAYPMFKEFPQRFGLDADPDAVILTCTDFTADEWADTRPYMEGLALLVLADGFYVWLALYRGADDEQEEKTQRDTLRRALRNHISRLVGGRYWNHSAGRKDSQQDQEENSQEEANQETLETYRNKNLGVLSFFQINLIFEGMHNYNLDPRVFFDSGEPRAKILEVKRSYSLGEFFGRITTNTQVALAGSDLITKLQKLFQLPEDKTAQWYFDFFKELRGSLVSPEVRRDLLRQFLRRTSTDTLHLLKWRIESCSRSLLSIMIRVAHLRQSLIQVEVPRSTNPDNPAQALYNIVGANEGQLRGYVILLAAKLPLIENVWHYLQNNLVKFEELLPQDPAVRTSIFGLERSWEALLKSIGDNIAGLEQAIEQAYMDQMLAETEKLRAEEETLAELERIRAQAGTSLSSAGNWTVSFIGNLITFAALLLTLAITAPQLNKLLSDVATFEGLGAIGTLVIVLVAGVVALLAVSTLVHGLLDSLLHALAKRREHRRQRDERYYYEMDLRLDVPIEPDSALSLFEGTFGENPGNALSSTNGKGGAGRLPRVEGLQARGLERNSYRVGRAAADEALHKIYMTAILRWPGRWLARERPRGLRALLAYEVLFHSPSAIHSYRLRDLRVVLTTVDLLDAERLRAIKVLIIEQLINPLISEPGRKLDSSTDALVSLRRDRPSSADHIAESRKAQLVRKRRT
jgi:hypothetical protein